MKRGIEDSVGGNTPRRTLEAGKSRETIKKISLADINSVTQVRRTIDQDGIDELVASIAIYEEDQLVGIDLHQDPTVALFEPDDAKRYLKEINELWGVSHSLQQLTSTTVDGKEKYVIVLAGHRRVEALTQIQSKHSDTDIDIHCVVYDGAQMSFDRALEIQYNENFHRRPESYEDAAAISDIYAAGKRKGKYKSYTDCARHLNIRVERVARAHRFTALPEIIQQATQAGDISYSHTLLFSQLCSAIAINQLPDDISEERKKELARRLGENKVHLTDLTELFTDDQYRLVEEAILFHFIKMKQARNRKRYIKLQVESLLGGMDMLQLFSQLEKEEDFIKAEQRNRDREMSKLAVSALRDLVVVLRYSNLRNRELTDEKGKIRGFVGLAIKGLTFKTKKDREVAIRAARQLIEQVEQDEVLL